MGRSILLVLATAITTGCAPVFSDLQSARLTGPGRVEVTPSGSQLFFSDDDGTEHVENHYGVQLAAGVAEVLDLRVRYERAPDVNVLGFGPKFGLLKDKLALAVPVGFAFGQDIDSGKTWEAHPTLLATWTPDRKVELTGSAKAIVPLSGENRDTLYAVNLGLGLGPDVSRWAFRPEVGFLWNPGESGHYTHLSLGLTFGFGGKRQ